MSWKLFEINDLLRQAIEAADAVIDHDTGVIPDDWA